MATMDRFGSQEQTPDVPARAVNLAWAQSITTWLATSAVGLMIVFIGLAVDGYRHNHSAAEESLLSLSNPGHLLAAIGLFVSAASVLLALTIALLHGAEHRRTLLPRMAWITGAWVLMATIGVGSITYLAASGATIGHSHSDATAAADTHTHAATTDASEAGGLATSLQQNGISTDPTPPSQNPASVPGALAQGADGHGGHAHDKGTQPTFTQIETMTDEQLLPLFPAGTMTIDQIPVFRSQLEQTREVAARLSTTDAAKAAGYVNTTSDVPYMGQHWLNFDILKSGKFDPAKPDGLLFSKIDDSGQLKLVGIWYLMIPGVGGVTAANPPANTWAGNLALWHEHDGLCLVGTKSASEGETPESCKAKGGSYTAALKWMMHVWVAPGHDNPTGVFSYLNNELFQQQQAAGNTAAPVQPQNGTIAQ